MADMHEATFSWPEIDADTVIVTGTFDQWSSSLHLTKTPRGFEGKVKLPWGDRVLYKFVVDGRWVTAQSQPEEPDGAGNLNNVYECPSKPESSTEPSSDTVKSKSDDIQESSTPTPASSFAPALISLTKQDTLGEKTSQVAQQIKEAAVTTTNDVLPESTSSALNQTHAAVVAPVLSAVQNAVHNPTGTLEQMKDSVPAAVADTAQKVSDTAKVAVEQAHATVAPATTTAAQAVQEAVTEKTPEPIKEQVNAVSETVQSKGSGALAFVASNLGTAIHAFTGVDPLNPDKIPVATPTPTHDAFIINPQDPSAGSQIPSRSVVEPEPTGPEPIEPYSIVPVSSDAETGSAMNGAPIPPTSIPVETAEKAPITSTPHTEAAAVESGAPVSSETETIPSVDAAVLAAPTSVPTETVETTAPGLSAHQPEAKAKAVETDIATPSVPVENVSDLPSEPAVADQPPSNDIPVPTSTPDTKPATVNETVASPELAIISPVPVTVDGSTTTSIPDVPNTDASQTEAKQANETAPAIAETIQIVATQDLTPVGTPGPAAIAEATPVPVEATPAAVEATPAAADVAPVSAEVAPVPAAAKPFQAEAKPTESIISPTAEAPLAEAAPPTPSAPAVDTPAAIPTSDMATKAKQAPSDTKSLTPITSTADTTESTKKSTEKPANGNSSVTASTPTKQLASESSTPQAFPTSSSATSSPAASKSGSTRKKRTSIFGKVKHLFSHDKEEKKERK